MRTRRQLVVRAGCLAIAAVSGLGLLVAGITPANAAAAAGFVVPGASPRLVVAGDRVFVSSGDDGDTALHVYDLAGSSIGSVAREADPESLDVSADGSRLYVGLADPAAVSVIDTTSLTEIARYDVSALGVPEQVVPVGDRLYVRTYADNTGSVGVVDTGQTPATVVSLLGRAAFGMSVTARSTSTQGTDELYTSECGFGGSCGVERYVYDGVHQVELAADAGSDEFGKIIWDAADDAVLTEASNGIAIRDPETLAVRWTVAGDLGYSSGRLLHQRLVSSRNDPSTGRTGLVVQDLTGAVTYAAAPSGSSARLAPALQSDSGTTAYATERATDGTVRLVAFPHALERLSTPAGPTMVRAVAGPAGRVDVTWTASAQDYNDAPTRYEVSRSLSVNGFGPPIAVLAPNATSYRDTGAVAGRPYYYRVAAINSLGEGVGETAEPTTPDATAPTVRVTAPAPFTVAPTLTVAYHATDAGSGVANHDVRYRVAAWNGAFGAYVYPTTWQRRSAGSVPLPVSAGHDYCVSVRGRDRAGNLSGWSADRCSAAPLDDRSLHRATTGWRSVADTAAYRGTTTVTSTARAALTVPSVAVDRVAIVATTCPSCGSVAVYLDGRYWRAVSLRSTATKARAVLVLPAFSLRHATITVVNRTGAKVVVDGLGISRS